MKTLIRVIFATVALTLCAEAQNTKMSVPVTTTQFGRSILQLETASDWRNLLGVGAGGSATNIFFQSSGNAVWDFVNGSNRVTIVGVLSNGSPSITIGTNNTLVGGSNTIDQINGLNSQRWNLYDTFTDVNNYRRASVYFSGGDLHIGSNPIGTPASSGDFILEAGGRHHMGFWTWGTNWWNLQNNGIFQGLNGAGLVVPGLTSLNGGLNINNATSGAQIITNAGVWIYYTNGFPLLPGPNGSIAYGDGNLYSRTNGFWVPVIGSGGGGGGGDVVAANYTTFGNSNLFQGVVYGSNANLSGAFNADNSHITNSFTSDSGGSFGNSVFISSGNLSLSTGSVFGNNGSFSGTVSGTSVNISSATASTVPLFDGGKNIVSLANPSGTGTWMLTSDGSGVKTWVLTVDGSALKASQYTATGSATNLISTQNGNGWTNLTYTSATLAPASNQTNYILDFSFADKIYVHSANTNAHFTFTNISTNRQFDLYVVGITSSVPCNVDFPLHVRHNHYWNLTATNGQEQIYHIEARGGVDATNVGVFGGDYVHRD